MLSESWDVVYVWFRVGAILFVVFSGVRNMEHRRYAAGYGLMKTQNNRTDTRSTDHGL